MQQQVSRTDLIKTHLQYSFHHLNILNYLCLDSVADDPFPDCSVYRKLSQKVPLDLCVK